MALENFSTPVLFIVFNRLETTRRVFEAIRQAKPPRLYIASDGPREAKPDDDLKVREVREFIMGGIDWKCEVKTLFRQKNLGCKYAVSGAITWFFKNEKQGIILEDDTLPSLSFFGFCERLLEKYKDNRRIWHISGANVQIVHQKPVYSYHFSIYPGIWGWASWADRWEHYDLELNEMRDIKFITDMVVLRNSIDFWKVIFKKMKKKKIDTWDFQWVFTIWSKGGLSITPNLNQVSNIGFNKGGTHTVNAQSALANLRIEDIKEIVCPQNVVADDEQDRRLSNAYFSRPSLLIRFWKKIKGI